MNYKKALIALDGSQLAEAVLPYAAELAARLDLDLVFLNVCHTSEADAFPACTDYLNSTAASIETMVEQIRMSDRAVKGKSNVEVLVEEGYPPEVILRVAAEKKVDIIFMSTHGASGLRGWFVGSVADKVIKRSSVPVFLARAGIPAPEGYKEWLHGSVLVPLDGSKAAEAVLPHLEALARQPRGDKTDIRLLRIVEPLWETTDFPEAGVAVAWDKLEDAREQMRAQAEEYIIDIVEKLGSKGLMVSSEVKMSAPAASGIIEYATSVKAELVVMASRGLSGGDKWEFGGNANKVLNKIPCPLLIVRPD